MIRFQLRCAKGDGFEAWFRGNAQFEEQVAAGQIECPACGSHAVEKALMMPAVTAATRNRDASASPQKGEGAGPSDAIALAAGLDPNIANAMEVMRDMTRKFRATSDYVGPRFAEEARKIHYEEAPARSIYGEATEGEARALAEEGIGFHPLPVLPEDRN